MGYVRTHGHCRYLGWRWRFEDVRFLFPFLFCFKHVVCVFFLLRSTVVADRLRAPKKRHVCLLRVCGVSYSLVVYNRRSSLSAASAVSRCSAEARGFLTLPERWWAARPSTSRPGTPGTDTRVRSTHVARVRVHVVRMSKLRTYVIRMYVAVCRFTQGTFVFVSLVLSVIQGMNPRQRSFWKSGLCWLKNQHRLA